MDVKETLKDSTSISDVADRLGLNLQKTGRSLQGHCPTGHESKSGRCFSIVPDSEFFNCFNCGEGGDVIRLVEIAKKLDFKDSLKWLAREFRPDLLSEIEKNNIQITPQSQAIYQTAHFFELIFEYGKRLLYESQGKVSLDYLIHERGYKEEQLKNTEWMYFPKDKEAKQYLTTLYPHLESRIQKLKLQGYFGDNFRLGFPYRNRKGMILGFGKRATSPEGSTVTTYDGKVHKNVRWDSTSGLKKEDLFGLHACKRETTLILVEGYPDALYLPSLGFRNIVAVAQGVLSESHLPGLLASKAQRIIIAFDNDACKNGNITGIENTQRAIELLSKTNLRTFVIDPPLFGECKDPDEFIKHRGVDAFRTLTGNAISASKWMAQRIGTKYTLTNDIQRENALREAIDYSLNIRNTLDTHDFFRTISQVLDIPESLVEQKMKERSEQKALKNLKQGYNALLKEAGRRLESGRITELDEHLSGASRELRLQFEKIKAQPSMSLNDYLEQKYTFESQREPGLLGYDLKAFETISQKIDGIQPGFYILAAETNIGKTAFLSNLFLDVLLTNSHVKAIYFSLDDAKDVIINRLLGILSGLNLNLVQRRQSSSEKQVRLRNAYNRLIEFSREGRMEMKDLADLSHIDMLELEVRKRAKDNLVVFIDGLYNLEVGNSSGGLREENIDRANKVKALVDTYKIPIFCTGEIRKKLKSESSNKPPTIHDIMETGKVAYNANLVWLLYPKDQDQFKQQDKPTLILDYAKNKLSHFKGFQKLTFVKQQGLLQEYEGD